MSKSKKIVLAIVAFLLLIVVIYFSLPKYAQIALIYQKVGINDYPIFENRIVKKTTAQPWKVNDAFTKIKLDDNTLNKFNELQTIAYLVIKDNEIIFEQYWDGYGTQSHTNSFSMAKSIVSLAIGAAIDDGYIESVFQPISAFIPEYKTEQNEELQIRDVLSMSSGLSWDESYGSLFNRTTEAYYGKDIRKLIYSLEVIEEPGKEFKYLSGNTQLLAMVVEAATGKKLSDYVAEKFWQPMGAENEALWSLDNVDGMEKAYCCFNSNARDFARWGQLILNQGVWNNDTLISPEYISAAIKPAQHLVDETGNNIDYYGFQWWIQHINNWDIPYMRGILGQYVFAIPEENAVIVRLGHNRTSEKKNHHPLDTWLYVETATQIIEDFKALE